MSGYPGQVHHGDELEHAGAGGFGDLLGDQIRAQIAQVQKKIASASSRSPAHPSHPSHREWLAAVGNAIKRDASARAMPRHAAHPSNPAHFAFFRQLGSALGLGTRFATGSGYPGHVHHGDEMEHAGFSASRGFARQYTGLRAHPDVVGSGYPGAVHHGDELEHAGADAPLAVPPPRHPRLDHGVRYFDPEVESHAYKTVARGRFHIIRTTGGRFYACVSVETLLGHMCVAIHLERHAVQALVEAQREHHAAQQQPMTTGFDFGDIGKAVDSAVHTVEHITKDVAKTVEHVAAPVVHAVTDVANKTGHAIEQAAKQIAKTTGKVVSDAVKEGAKIVAKAHLGDLNASKMINDIVHTAQHGVDALGHVVDDTTHLRFQKMADGLAQGAQFVLHNVDMPRILADAIPIPEVRAAAQSVIGLVDPAAKFEKAIGALRAGDMNQLKAMANQELSEMQGVISLVPGIGSGVSAAIGTAEALLNGGKPLEVALRTAYGLLPIPPGIRQVTDTVLDAVISLANGGDVTDAALAVARDRIPSGVPRDVFDTLVQIIAKHQPIEKAAADLAGHYVMQYTQGLVPAVEHGLQNLVPAHVADILHGLPDMTQKFAGFAPQFKQIAHVAEAIRSGAPRMAALASLAQPSIIVNRALPAAAQSLPPAMRHIALQLGR
jgi:hypothetical protein